MNCEQIEHELLPKNFKKYDETTQMLIIEYLKTLNVIEKKAYTIGQKHLGPSFNLVKSNGFINWKKSMENK